MIQYINWDENGLLTVVGENGKIIFANENTYMTDKYGNTLTVDDIKVICQRKSPTYDELYAHWLETKQND